MLLLFYDGQYGFVNQQGEIVIPTEYQEAEEFNKDGSAAVRRDDHWGLINEKGESLIPFEYNSMYAFGRKWVHAKKGQTEFLFTTSGEKILQVEDILYWHYPEDGIIRVKKKSGWGGIDMNGNTIIPFKYISLGPCKNNWLSFYENGFWGWLNKKGDLEIPALYKEVGFWNEQYWWCRDTQGYHFISILNKCIYEEIWLKILQPINNIGAVKTNEGWKYIDSNLNSILQLSPIYEWVEHFREERAAVKSLGQWGFINNLGEEIISPIYTKVHSFSEGFAAVQLENLWGFIDKEGVQMIPFQYEAAGSFCEGKAWASNRWEEWYIDRDGLEVTKRRYID